MDLDKALVVIITAIRDDARAHNFSDSCTRLALEDHIESQTIFAPSKLVLATEISRVAHTSEGPISDSIQTLDIQGTTKGPEDDHLDYG